MAASGRAWDRMRQWGRDLLAALFVVRGSLILAIVATAAIVFPDQTAEVLRIAADPGNGNRWGELSGTIATAMLSGASLWYGAVISMALETARQTPILPTVPSGISRHLPNVLGIVPLLALAWALWASGDVLAGKGGDSANTHWLLSASALACLVGTVILYPILWNSYRRQWLPSPDGAAPTGKLR